jgi:ribosomal protein S18 acetylase RimI-like enzyme
MKGSHSIDIGAAPGEVWGCLVAPGFRDWYYRLTPEGEFTPGGHIRWLDIRGELVEESDIIDVDAPRKLALRTRYLFAPPFAAAPPHELTWEVTGIAGGSLVRMSWIAEEPVHQLMQSQGDAQLKGLRLAADPSARAELERLPEIGDVEIVDVTPERVPAYQHFFDDIAFRDFPAWQDCYCKETHRAQDEKEGSAADNRRDMSESIRQGRVTALLALAGGEPVGWCNYGETTRLAGVMSRFKLEAAHQQGVGSIACFVIASPYRGHRVASKLLDAAIDRLRARGVREVEAYPSRGGDDSAQGNYRGPLSMYVRAGFEPYRELERHVVMRKRLA